MYNPHWKAMADGTAERRGGVRSDVLVFDDAAGWDAWLAEHHDSSDGVVLRIARKGHPGLTIRDALEVALCHGWIDSVRRAGDEAYFRQRYSRPAPGQPVVGGQQSPVGDLTAAGRMRPGGLAQVEASGRRRVADTRRRRAPPSRTISGPPWTATRRRPAPSTRWAGATGI